MHVERVRHGGRLDFPDFRRSKLRCDIDPVHRERVAIDPHHLMPLRRHSRARCRAHLRPPGPAT